MKNVKESLVSALTLALFLVLAPDGLAAQEQQEQEMEPQCTAEVVPQQIQAGHPAVRVALTLSEAIGPVSGLEAPEASGLAVASPEDLPRSEMANEEAEESTPSPIELGAEGNRVTLWLNTAEAVPGTHAVTLTGEQGSCAAEVTVAEGQDAG